jgi:hypothetical protein
LGRTGSTLAITTQDFGRKLKTPCATYQSGFCNDFFGKRGNMRNNNGKTFEAVLGTIEW